MFEGVCGKLEAKKCQSFTKYLRLTLVFMWNSALQEFFASINNKDLALGYHSMKFRNFLDIF